MAGSAAVVTCLDSQTLLALLNGNLADALESEAVAHVETCPECQERLEQLTVPTLDDRLSAGQKQVWERLFAPEQTLFNRQLDRTMSISNSRTAGGQVAISQAPVIPGYEIRGVLGRGGMGTVYAGRHAKLDRDVAIKVVPVAAAQRARSDREMTALGRMNHRHVVQTYDAGETNDVSWIVMEHLKGRDLSCYVGNGRQLDGARLPVDRVCEYIRLAALGLQAIHDEGLVHRDVKPSNLFLTSGRDVKLLDLGLVSLDSTRSVDGALTDEATIMGSLDYIAPEQACDSTSADVRSDIYALGCTLFALLTGRPPFCGEPFRTASQKLLAHACEPRPDARQWNPDVPPDLARLVQNMMHTEPAQRPVSGKKVADTLTQFCGNGRGSSRGRTMSAAAFGGILLLLSVIIIKLSDGSTIRIETEQGVKSISVTDPKTGDVTEVDVLPGDAAPTDRNGSASEFAELKQRFPHIVRSHRQEGLAGFALTPDEKTIYTSGVDGKILRWMENRSDPEIAYSTVDLRPTRTLVVSHDGNSLLFSSKGILSRLDLATRTPVWQVSANVASVRILPDGKKFLALHRRFADVTMLRSLATGELLAHTVTYHAQDIPDVTDDLKHLVYVSPNDHAVRLKAPNAKRFSDTYIVEGMSPRYATFSADEKMIFAIDQGMTVVWDRDSKEIVRQSQDTTLVREHLFPLPTAGQYLSVEGASELVIWNPLDGTEFRRLGVPRLQNIEMSSSGRYALIQEKNNRNAVHLVDLQWASESRAAE